MITRKLSREETNLIREYIQEGVAAGETEQQIQQRRRELAEVLGCSLPQVAASSAWKSEGDRLVLKPLELETKESQSEEIRQGPEINEPNLELAKDLEDGTMTSSRMADSHIKIYPKSGAWTDYENSAVKEIWRQTEMNFLDRHLDIFPKRPEEMRVLCTPGIKCHLEVRHLLQRGFRPENIFAIEREKGAWSDFEKSCHEIGIQPRYGELKEILPQMREPFDVVMLDFLGSYCLSYQEVIYQVPLAKRAMVALNMSGKRERGDAQRVMQGAINVAKNDYYRIFGQKIEDSLTKASAYSKAEDLTLDQRRLHFDSVWKKTHQDVIRELSETEIEMSDDHRDAQMHALLHELGTGRPDNWTFPKAVNEFPIIFSEEDLKSVRKTEGFNTNFLRAKNIHAMLQRFENEFFSKYRMLAFDGRMELRPLSLKVAPLIDMAGQAMTGKKKILALERYRYLSRVGETPSPYLTDLAIVDWPVGVYKDQHRSVHFASKCSHELALGLVTKVPRKFAMGFTESGVIRIDQVKHGNKQFHVAAVALRDLLADMEKWEELNEAYPISKYDFRLDGIERVNLE